MMDSQGEHISNQFDLELDNLNTLLLEAGGLVERQLAKASYSLLEYDTSVAQKVVDCDDEIDSLECKIDESAHLIIAKRQPTAKDLRLVLTIIKTIRDLERMGDESSKIAKMAIRLSEETESRIGFAEFRRISERVQSMVKSCLDAFARSDVAAAVEVAKEDSTVDMEYASAMRALITYMIEDQRSITRVLNLLWALRALERIGDHARNIAEQVIYLVNGTDVRHSNIEDFVVSVNKTD